VPSCPACSQGLLLAGGPGPVFSRAMAGLVSTTLFSSGGRWGAVVADNDVLVGGVDGAWADPGRWCLPGPVPGLPGPVFARLLAWAGVCAAAGTDRCLPDSAGLVCAGWFGLAFLGRGCLAHLAWHRGGSWLLGGVSARRWACRPWARSAPDSWSSGRPLAGRWAAPCVPGTELVSGLLRSWLPVEDQQTCRASGAAFRHGGERGPRRDGVHVCDETRHVRENNYGTPSGHAFWPIRPW